MLKEFWNGLALPARIGLSGGVALVCIATVVAGLLIWRTDYQVLFADLKPQDAAMMAAELDRLKLPYKVAAEGNAILVDGNVVHATRLKLMGKDMPLHGAAGFELFNNADFGMTEFAQKINYQRALQGEITRTILSLAEVRDARVHLALAEQGLFKHGVSKAKAAITLSMRPGQSLRPEQITGIQRLVSAAVPGIVAQNVTIVDQHGVALTRAGATEGEQDASSSRLDLKRETERHLARKATDVLEGVFGAGQAMASVDVTLNMDQVRVTTEDVLGAPSRPGQNSAGVMVKEREVARDVGSAPNAPDGGRASNSQREVEYQVGRRIEQVASQPGAIRQLHVVAVIRKPIDEGQKEQMQALVAATVGAVAERGDVVVVQNLKHSGLPAVDEAAASPTHATSVAPPGPPASAAVTSPSVIVTLLACGAALAAGAGWLLRRRASAEPHLTEQQRQLLLEQMLQWLDGARPLEPAAPTTRHSAGSGVRS